MKRSHPEDGIQKAIVSYMHMAAAPGVFIAAIPNGGLRSHLEAKIMKGLGVRAGVADLFVVGPGAKVYFVEVKAPKGRLSEHQIAFQDWCLKHQVPHAVVRSLDEAIEFFRRHGLVSDRVRIAA